MAIVRDTMHQRGTLNHRVPHGALVMLERSAGKLARSVLRGEESREALFLPGAAVQSTIAPMLKVLAKQDHPEVRGETEL